MEVKNYFPRVYNYNEISKDPKKFEKILIDIFKSLVKKNKNSKSSAASLAKSLQKDDDRVVNKEENREYVQGV